MGTGGAYLASKKPGGMCTGPWTLPCIVIPVIIDEISDGGGEQQPPPDLKERTIDTAAALYIAQTNITKKAVNQTDSQFIANGGNEDVDIGDSFGLGGKEIGKGSRKERGR